VDIDRPAQPQQMDLGQGPHFCAGRELGWLEFETLFAEVLARIPDYQVDVVNSRRFDDAATMYGWQTMPATTNL
jgi:cytochrome P450